MKSFLIGFYVTIGIISLLLLLFHLLTKKYIDIYTLTTYFGRKGCGKSTTMQKLALQHKRKGWHVYADANSTDIKGVTFINCDEVWNADIKPHSVVLIDESVIKWNKRAWKDFPPEAQEWFICQRKHKVKVIMFSNTFGVDSSIRDMTDYLIVCRKYLRIFMIGRKWYKIPTVITAEESGREARGCDDFKKVPLFFGGIVFTFLPLYVKHFDTNKVYTKSRTSGVTAGIASAYLSKLQK